jgi:class 3 adenylate cyclase/tetratricopeptide (TPR) repeat protein
MPLDVYLPQDRRRALANHSTLPDHANGAALFADISGFTALTESLRERLGARLGAEALNTQLGAVYSALITEVEKYGGSVIGFAGDAMMCWFDNQISSSDRDGSALAVACAFGMQAAIRAFPTLALKVAIATGIARRFVVGDPDVQQLDVLVGGTVARTSTAEHQAKRGEILVDEATVRVLGDSLTVTDWRMDIESNERFAVVSRYADEVNEAQIETPDSLSNDVLRSWIHRTVFERETSSQDAFLTEFRPCVALFVRFTGIDYDSDTAESELDGFIRQVQTITARHHGTLLDITIGDKGSYAYISFGALGTHEDDSRRAVKTALELKDSSSLSLQMGITQGLMRVGAYGSETRKTFGALGDEVNLSARLMMTAAPGEILLSNHGYKAVQQYFSFEPRPPLPMKGKAEPLPVFAVTGKSHKRAVRLQEPNYALPMVGRTQELKSIEEKLDLALSGRSQVIGIVGEAGMGKSRLVAEVIRSARRKGFVGFGGACQSDGVHTPYLVWKSIWQAFFDVDPDMPLRKQMRNVEGELEDRAPNRMDAMPLLNTLLDLNIPENEFTQNLEPKIRQSALHALVEDCLKSAAKDDPILIVIEDLHWIDALSHDLLEGLSKALANQAICFVLAYRPPKLERLQAPRLESLPEFTRVELHELKRIEAEGAIRAKLAQLYPARSSALPIGLLDTLMARSQGNPFYLEELLNYMRDRGLDPADLHSIELPDSLHTLILSRIDQLSEQEKTTLRAASIVGRLFRAKWLLGYYPELGSSPQVKATLDELDALDITPLDSTEPELAYLFKHIITHEVTYESLPFATRARLHEQLARYLESLVGDTALLLDSIAFHYGCSENQEKQREYWRKAGEAAQKNFANDAALDYYEKLLPLLKDAKEQTQIHMQRGQVFELMGKWDIAEAEYRAAMELSKEDAASKASAQFALGKLNRLRGDYEPALDWLARAKQARKTLEDTTGLAQVLIETGMVLWCKAEYAQVREPLNEGLALARAAGDKQSTAQALNNLGNVVSDQGDDAAARALYEESLALRREMGDKRGIAASLNNLGNVVADQGDNAAARALYEESLALKREMGDKWGIAGSLSNLGNMALAQGDYPQARMLYEESLALGREMGDKGGTAMSLYNLGNVAFAQGDYSMARALQAECLALAHEIGDKSDMAYALSVLGLADLAEHKPEAREHILRSLHLRQEMGRQLQQISSLIGVAGLVLEEGNPHFAAQLLGTVESALKTLNAVAEPDVKFFHEQTLAAVCERVGEAAFQSAWEEGSKWSLEEAVTRALEEYGG